MSRVQCLECGIAVVVDPSGLCPDGHQVGASGARIDQSLGSQVRHPAEPEPWVAKVDVPRSPATPDVTRPIRPVSAPAPMPVPGPATNGSAEDDIDSEALLRELHALNDLDDRTSVATPVRPTAHDAPSAADDAPLPAYDGAERTGEAAEAFAELAALETAVQSLQAGVDERGSDEPGAYEPPTHGIPVDGSPAAGETRRPHLSAVDDVAALEELFAASDLSPRPGSYAPVPALRTAPTPVPAARPAPVAAPTSAPVTAPATAPVTAPALPPDPAPVAAPTAAALPAPVPAPSAASEGEDGPPETEHSLDLANFTARGTRVAAGGGRRRLFGR